MRTCGYVTALTLWMVSGLLCDGRAALVAHWPLNEGTGQIAADRGGSRLDGVLGDSTDVEVHDPAWVNDPDRGPVLEWTGDSGPGQWINLTSRLDSFRTLGEGSILAWVRIPGDDTVDVILAASDRGDPSSEMRFFYDPTYGGIPGLRYDVREGGDTFFQLSTFPVDPGDDQWHHAAVTVDAGGQIVLYVDGVAVTTGREAGFFSAVQDLDHLSIGRNIDSGGPQWVFKGRMNDLAVFDRPLSAGAIKAVYEGWLSISEIDKTVTVGTPSDGARHVNCSSILQWQAPTGLDGPVTYDIFLDEDADFLGGPISSGRIEEHYTPDTLKPATTFFWRIDANVGEDRYRGVTRSFTTAGLASDPEPADDSTEVYTATALRWQGDASIASYDVYLGDSPESLQFQGNTHLTELHPACHLDGPATYYWRIDTRDEQGRQIATGAIWKFMTNAPGVFFEENNVFVSGIGGYHTYRIPAVIVAPNGDLLAFCEGRMYSSADHGNNDIVMKRSTDGGRTWREQEIVYEEGGASTNVTIGNPCVVVDQETGIVWLSFCRENSRVFIGCSRDSGMTWSERREITAAVKPHNWSWYATGPGVGIQLRQEPFEGRLVMPCDHIADGSTWSSHMIYSDDHGETWQCSEEILFETNECQVVELADGTLMNNMRNRNSGRDYRGVATSTDGGLTWSEVRFDEQLPGPTCQASFLRHTLAEVLDRNRVLFSNPAHTSSRVNMTVRLSYDEGRTWPVSRQVYEGSSAYSCLTVLPDNSIGCLYEKDGYGKIAFARFSLEWLTGGADRVDVAAAHMPHPAAGASGVAVPVQLRWTPGRGALRHRIYLAQFPLLDEAAFVTEQQQTHFDAGLLAFGLTWYWRVDEVQANGTIITGQVWSFKTVTPECPTAPASDLNDDCIVDVADLIILAGNWMDGFAARHETD